MYKDFHQIDILCNLNQNFTR